MADFGIATSQLTQTNYFFALPLPRLPPHKHTHSDQHGFTPLHYACMYGHANIVEMFLMRGARTDITNMGGDSLLHMAAAHGKYDIVVKVCGTCHEYLSIDYERAAVVLCPDPTLSQRKGLVNRDYLALFFVVLSQQVHLLAFLLACSELILLIQHKRKCSIVTRSSSS